MEGVGEKKSKVAKGLVKEGFANTVEKEWIEDKLEEFGIMLCGSARVGKSTLINAICGKTVAATSARLDSCTTEVAKYPLQVSYNDTDENGRVHKRQTVVSFWDTPGIESWSETQVKQYVLELLSKTNPICMIFCAAPGSFAKTEHVKWFVEACYGSKIFFSLVMTNKFSGSKEQKDEIIASFIEILATVSGYDPQITTDGIYLVPKVGLVAAVNSRTFDNGYGFKVGPEGVNELCISIMRELDEEKLKGWCVTLLENRDFWTRMSHQLAGFFKDKVPAMVEWVKNAFQEFINPLAALFSQHK